MLEEGDFYTLEELELLVKVALDALAAAQVNQEINGIDDNEETRLDQIADENDVMDIEDDAERGQSAEATTPPTAEFKSGLWQCQVCQKQMIESHTHSLLKHIGTHENIFCRCPIAGCAKTCRTTSGLRTHLQNYHRLRAADLSAKQHGRLLEGERKFYESARNHLARYFPPGAKLQQQPDHEAST
ncbi:hypothetical protein QR680_012056 [Steinernema hermaphroditum]|uniref:C2H2-type domain-containing protein n=1 Tax=Steinernema hermaphroditum TaxID=289476 RepID=A0AA39LZW1_9BILA|nr:hypothetical protein QR680_012056 [Steinernema hermaphroditum]